MPPRIPQTGCRRACSAEIGGTTQTGRTGSPAVVAKSFMPVLLSIIWRGLLAELGRAKLCRLRLLVSQRVFSGADLFFCDDELLLVLLYQQLIHPHRRPLCIYSSCCGAYEPARGPPTVSTTLHERRARKRRPGDTSRRSVCNCTSHAAHASTRSGLSLSLRLPLKVSCSTRVTL